MPAAALLLCLPLFTSADEPKIASPMESFGRLVGDEWRVTAQSGKSMYHTWHWGPGQHSIRRVTNGLGAGGNPWREVQVYYWHPADKQVRFLGLSPFDGGVFEGSFKAGKETAEGYADLHQSRARRQMKVTWEFGGPDKYREALLEANQKGVYSPLVEFDHVRVKPPAKPREFSVEGQKPSERLKAFAPLLGGTWEAKGETINTKTKFLWVPLADAVYARVEGKDSEHLLDVYVYHHTGAKALRCLALSSTGSVYEGEVTTAERVIEMDLKGHENGKAVRNAVRFDFEKDGSVRQRVWSVKEKERVVVLDTHQRRVEIPLDEELKAMAGIWNPVFAENNGVKAAERDLKGTRWVRGADGKWEFQREGRTVLTWTVKAIDATKTLKAIDIEVADGTHKGTVYKGIYEIKDDTLRICFALPDRAERPTEFKAGKGSVCALSEFKREKK